jgi:hypothetical protein
MLFPTHLAAAGLFSRVSDLSPLWLVIGAAMPDLVDKPLGLFGITTLFHSVGHAGLVVVVVLVPIALSSRGGLALATGWVSHLVLDAVHVIVNGRASDALFLFWPVVRPPDPPAIPPGSFFWYYLGTPSFYLELLIWGILGTVAVRIARHRLERTD